MDVTAIQRYLAELGTLSDTALIAADFDCDECVSIIDATLLQKYLAQLLVPGSIASPYYPNPMPEDPEPPEIPVIHSGYVRPAPGVYYISCAYSDTDFGESHSGVDITGPLYSSIVAADSGTVIATYSGCIHNWGKSGDCGCGSYGNYVMIDHGNGKMTIYGHLSTVDVTQGQVVSAGQQIGTLGSTGKSVSPHLHF